MPNKIFLYLKNYDWILFFSVIILISIGLAEIYSVALGREGADFLNFKKQIFFIAAGIVLLFFFSFFDYHILGSFSNYIYLLGAVMLLGVIFFGVEVRGTRGWFNLGGFNLQPVEFVKIILILVLAKFFSSIPIKASQLKYLLLSALLTFILAGLVLVQPDFGSASLLFVVWVAMAFTAGFKKRYFFIIGIVLACFFAAGWFFYFEDYQKQRILTFLNPSFDSLDQGYNVAQAMIAVGAGGLSGRGIGFGSQSQLRFLPESQNDFIFAVIAEELGFWGVSLVLILFLVFFYRCLANIKKINNDFGIFLIMGSMALIFIEMFTNIGMNIGLLPVIGISLPFLSYGGSAIISTLMLVGIIQNVIIKSKINY